MAHAKQQVREAVATLLDSAPVAWGMVWQHRDPPERGVTPYVLVYVESETVETLGIEQDALQQRDMLVSVRGRLRDLEGEANENRADNLCAEVESALTFSALNTALSNKLRILQLETTSSQETEDENERIFLEIALDFRVQVMTIQSAPETLL